MQYCREKKSSDTENMYIRNFRIVLYRRQERKSVGVVYKIFIYLTIYYGIILSIRYIFEKLLLFLFFSLSFECILKICSVCELNKNHGITVISSVFFFYKI